MTENNNKIYLDYAATTPVDREVMKAMLPYFSDKFGNASSIHSFGQEAITAVDQAREKIARYFDCDFTEIIFTGSATESNNLAIMGIVKKIFHPTGDHPKGGNFQKKHIITTAIEHESALEPLRELGKAGCEITYLPVDKEGLLKISDLEKSIKDTTILVSIIYANNEIGTIQPIKEIGKLLEKINKKRKEIGLSKIYFHTDAVQALNYLECRPDWLKVDLLTFSGHKIYGPKGIGGLYIRKGTSLSPIVSGGGQEFGLRSGTENIASIVGLAKAVESASTNKEKNYKKVLDLRNQMLTDIIKYRKGTVKLNGSPKSYLPNILNLRFLGLSNETLIVALDQVGVAVSAGSACSGRALSVSHVLTAIGLTPKQAKESIRISIGKNTTKQEIKKAVRIINKYEKLLV
ncbi:MAG: cysteine desulfurase family protein [Candidatus Azambacteria bacterium]|nr:cysteine desulfurase family protein [Candidatus Azambacteria bacterium]